MTKGYIYVSIQSDPKINKRILGFKYVDAVLKRSYIYTQEINPDTKLILCYLEGFNTVLRNYIEVVGKKQWVKYDVLNLATDKKYKNLSKKLDVYQLIRSNDPTDNLIKVALDRYIELVKIIGKINIIYKPDTNYADLLGAIKLKLAGESNG